MSDLEILELAHNWCHENFSSFGVPKLHSGALTSSLVELIKKTHTSASPVAPAPPTGNNSRYAGLEDDAKWIRESATHSEIVNILKHRVDLFARVTELEAALAPVAPAPPKLTAQDIKEVIGAAVEIAPGWAEHWAETLNKRLAPVAMGETGQRGACIACEEEYPLVGKQHYRAGTGMFYPCTKLAAQPAGTPEQVRKDALEQAARYVNERIRENGYYAAYAEQVAREIRALSPTPLPREREAGK